MLPEGDSAHRWLVSGAASVGSACELPRSSVIGRWAGASAAVYGLGHRRNGAGQLLLVSQKSRIRRIAGDVRYPASAWPTSRSPRTAASSVREPTSSLR